MTYSHFWTSVPGWDTVRRAVEDFVKDKDQLKIFITEPNEYLITNLEFN